MPPAPTRRRTRSSNRGRTPWAPSTPRSRILSVPAESAANGLPELTGLSSRSRARRAGDMVPSASPVNFDEWKGLGLYYLSKKPEAGLLMNTNSTKGHAEGDALLQLAAQRMRMPPAFNGAPASDWFAVGGREGGCGELLVDRKPCSSSCAPEGIANARRTAGLQTLIGALTGRVSPLRRGRPDRGDGMFGFCRPARDPSAGVNANPDRAPHRPGVDVTVHHPDRAPRPTLPLLAFCALKGLNFQWDRSAGLPPVDEEVRWTIWRSYQRDSIRDRITAHQA